MKDNGNGTATITFKNKTDGQRALFVLVNTGARFEWAPGGNGEVAVTVNKNLVPILQKNVEKQATTQGQLRFESFQRAIDEATIANTIEV